MDTVMNTVVVYYSRSGSTKNAAGIIAGKLGCERIEIINSDPRKGIFGFLKSGMEAASKKIVKIAPLEQDFSVYDRVIVCTPVWANNMSSPIRSFLCGHHKELNKICCLATCLDPKEDGKILLADDPFFCQVIKKQSPLFILYTYQGIGIKISNSGNLMQNIRQYNGCIRRFEIIPGSSLYFDLACLTA